MKTNQLSLRQKLDVNYDWTIWARDNQLEPLPYLQNGLFWVTWLILAGRGYGKTRTGAETVNAWAKSGNYGRIALIATDAADGRDVMVEGESGIIACAHPHFRPYYEPSKRRLTYPNGAQAFVYSAEDPDSLRGPQFHAAWGDEICKWAYAIETWDNLQFGLRLGENPKQIITTTPRPIKLLKDIISRDDTYITTGTTYENLENLAPAFRAQIVTRYEGTRTGRQELNAELLEDIPGALWQRSQIDECRAKRLENGNVEYKGKETELTEIFVAVDPTSGSGDDDEEKNDECGIVVFAKGRDGRGYVLADKSIYGSPDEWGKEAVKAYDEFSGNWLVYEGNQGGEMVASVIRACAKSLREEGKRTTDHIPCRKVIASRGKATRAEPVSALYEQKRVSHVGCFSRLEDQMAEFTADFDKDKAGYSPDRVDALVWAITCGMVNAVAHEGLFEFYRLANQKVHDRLAAANSQSALPSFVALAPPPSVNRTFGSEGETYVMKDGKMMVAQKDVPILLQAGFRYYAEPTA